MPHGSNRRAVTWADRYVVLLAGYRYASTWRVDGTTVPAHSESERERDWRSFFEDTVLVFDAATGELGRADPLLETTSYPSSAIDGDTIYCLGGEGGRRLWHPATLQIGAVRRAADG
jgi:hypothetical protein